MSLEKSIKRLTQAIVGRQPVARRQRCTTMPRGGRTVCECQELDANGRVVTNGRVTITEGPCAQQGDITTHNYPPQPPELVGPPAPLPPLPPMPEYGWDCYWALKDMQDDTKRMESCCTLPPDVFTTSNRRCYYRDNPGGPIKTR